MTAERRARFLLALVVLGLPLALVGAWLAAQPPSAPVTVHGRVSFDGGWQPEVLRAEVGIPLRLRLVSDDVMHGFAVGHSDQSAIDMPPGKVIETSLTFNQPGTYTYYCTRWCGPDHWRMRGVIEVTGGDADQPAAAEPLYQSLGIDLDAPHPASAVPAERPSVARARLLGVAALPEGFRTRQDFVERPPAEIWQSLRRQTAAAGLTDMQVWDMVALLWRTSTTDVALEQGRTLYAQNCAACHGETGRGDGVMADSIVAAAMPGESKPARPANFTDASRMLGASPAALQGKILRGGMGTGMPYWGPVFTDSQLWALADYLWTFQFEEKP